jgi:hypothetical protein
MSGESKQALARQWVELPTAPILIAPSPGQAPSGAAGPTYNAGGGYIFTLTANTAAVIDLSTLDWQGPIDTQDDQRAGHGATGTFVTIRVVGTVPVYIAGYPTLAAYTAVPPTIAGTLGANPAGFSWPIFPSPATGPDPGQESGRFMVRDKVNHFLGMISTGTPMVYIYRSGVYVNSR